MRPIIPVLVSSLILTACVSELAKDSQWRAVLRTDQFTDARSCRVERGTPSRRSVERRYRTYSSAEFIVEDRDGELRIGAVMEPTLPMSGDLQIRVDNLEAWTITLADTPLDTAPAMPSYDYGAQSEQATKAIEQVQGYTLKMASPYRLAAGDKARQILDQILKGHVVKYRLLGINAASSSTGQFEVDDAFRAAVAQCGFVE